MKRRIIGFMLVGMACGCVLAQSGVKSAKALEKSKGWLDNFEQAQQEAKAANQPIFVFFTGSDWCGWCVKLHKEVLGTRAFENFAQANMVLFEADFPRAKNISKKVAQQNSKLAAQYAVRGYPTVVLVDATGKELGRTGYQDGGADKYVEHLKALLEKAGVASSAKPSDNKKLSIFDKIKAKKDAVPAVK